MTGTLIGTHNGTFHCDEVLACFMLRQLKQYKNADIVRTRDPKVLDTCDIVVDVGGVYDPETRRFDHHQRGFNHTLSSEHAVKLSSAGLVYKHHGRDVIRAMLSPHTIEDATLEIVYLKLYSDLIASVDGNDNGILQFDVPQETMKYTVKTDLPSRISRLNPAWNEEATDMVRDARFAEAIPIAGSDMQSILHGIVHIWLPSRQLARQAFDARHEYHASGQIVVLKSYFPWSSHLFQLERDYKPEHPLLYTVYPDTVGNWRVQAFAKSEKDNFSLRKALPEPWRGVRDEALSALTGIPGCIFAHAAGFIGGASSFESALQMAIRALEE